MTQVLRHEKVLSSKSFGASDEALRKAAGNPVSRLPLRSAWLRLSLSWSKFDTVGHGAPSQDTKWENDSDLPCSCMKVVIVQFLLSPVLTHI